VRLRGQWDRAVEVRFCAVKSRAVSNRNCAAAMRGGEQRNENDQSVTQVALVGRRRELDSVGVDGRVFERKTKPAKRAIGGEPNRRATGRSPVVAPMVGDRMVGSPSAEIRETRRGQAVFRAARSEEPPGGSQSVRSSDEAGNDRGAKGRRKVEERRAERRKRKPTRVPARANRWWNQPGAIDLGDTERLARWMATSADDYAVCCNGGGMDGAKGSERPINAGPTNGLPTVGCCPWQQNTSGRVQS